MSDPILRPEILSPSAARAERWHTYLFAFRVALMCLLCVCVTMQIATYHGEAASPDGKTASPGQQNGSLYTDQGDVKLNLVGNATLGNSMITDDVTTVTAWPAGWSSSSSGVNRLEWNDSLMATTNYGTYESAVGNLTTYNLTITEPKLYLERDTRVMEFNSTSELTYDGVWAAGLADGRDIFLINTGTAYVYIRGACPARPGVQWVSCYDLALGPSTSAHMTWDAHTGRWHYRL